MDNHLVVCFIASFLFVLSSPQGFSLEENFLLINGVTDEIVVDFGPHIEERISPCSSFKMILGLMGYEAGILIDEKNPRWDFQEGYDDGLDLWRASQTPQSWMKFSCVWYAKLLALEMGLEKIQSYLDSFEYGNQDMSGGLAQPGPSNPPWINSSLKISPREQVSFIQKMINRELPIASDAIEKTKMLVFKEQLPRGWNLFGKTGWSGSDVAKEGKILEHAWFAGWIEKDLNFYPFAYLIRDKKIDLDQRIPRVKQLLVESKIMLECMQE